MPTRGRSLPTGTAALLRTRGYSEAMTKLSALVLEDEWPARNYLVELIEATRLAAVVGAVATLGEAREALAALAVDVVFVDVQLSGGESGLDLVRSSPGEPAFVLATAFRHHAREAWDRGAVDYLLKPFSEERVEECLRRIAGRREIRGAGAMRVVARRKRSLVFLDPADIWAFEASDRLSYVHSRLGRFDIDLSLAAIENSVGRSLMRVHRNWLVNLELVRELERGDGETTLLVGDIHVPISRDRVQPLRAALLANTTGLRDG